MVKHEESLGPEQDRAKGEALGGASWHSTWLGGLSDKLVDRMVDPDTNNLHVPTGRLCPKCGLSIGADEPVRKTVNGDYQHDSC